jgi:hypothetical protein
MRESKTCVGVVFEAGRGRQEGLVDDGLVCSGLRG